MSPPGEKIVSSCLVNVSADCTDRNVHLTHFLNNFFLINSGLEVCVALCDAALGELSQRLINL
jgi:hypothetical protein